MMAKYKVNYTEIFRRSFIVEAESEEEAQEKMEYAAENIGGLVDVDHFDHWETSVEREANENDLKWYDELPKE